MEILKVAALVKALHLVGQVYRGKDGKPAEPVRKVLQQLDGASEMTLAEWVAARQFATSSAPKPRAKKKPEPVDLDEVLSRLEQAGTQAALTDAIAGLSLSAAEWKKLAKKLTGEAGRSGPAAREAVQTRLSDRLLLDERIESVKRQFNGITPPPAAS
jgi:hypothetical protein